MLGDGCRAQRDDGHHGDRGSVGVNGVQPTEAEQEDHDCGAQEEPNRAVGALAAVAAEVKIVRSSSTRSAFSRLEYSHHIAKTMTSPPMMSGSISGPTEPVASVAP